MTAGIETLRALAEPGVWDGIVRAGERLFAGLGDAAAEAGVAAQPTHAGTMFGFFFTESPIRSWEDAKRADTTRFAAFHRGMLERGVYLAPSQFEAWFLSTAHGDEEIDATVAAARRDIRLARTLAAMKVLLVTLYFPPAGGGGVQRPLKLAQYLPALGIETHVLAPDDPKWVHRDPDLRVPTQAWVHRVRYVGPRARKPAEELRAAEGLGRALVQAQVTARRLLVPDASVTWNLTAIPAAIRIVRREGIDAVITTSPPGSIHFVGAAVKQATGARWLADLRDPLVANQQRRADTVRHACPAGGERAARTARRPPRGRHLVRVGRDRRRGTRPRPARSRPHDRERMRLRRLRGPRVPTLRALPHHARGELLRKARPTSVPPGAARLGRRRGRPLRRRLPQHRPRVGRGARPRRPARADPVRASLRVAPPPARLRGAAPARAGRGWAGQGRAVGKGLRVPRRGQADPRRRARRTAPPPSSSARRAPASSSLPTTSRASAARCESCTRASSTAAFPAVELSDDVRGALSRRARVEEMAELLREVVASKPGYRLGIAASSTGAPRSPGSTRLRRRDRFASGRRVRFAPA